MATSPFLLLVIRHLVSATVAASRLGIGRRLVTIIKAYLLLTLLFPFLFKVITPPLSRNRNRLMKETLSLLAHVLIVTLHFIALFFFVFRKMISCCRHHLHLHRDPQCLFPVDLSKEEQPLQERVRKFSSKTRLRCDRSNVREKKCTIQAPWYEEKKDSQIVGEEAKWSRYLDEDRVVLRRWYSTVTPTVFNLPFSLFCLSDSSLT